MFVIAIQRNPQFIVVETQKNQTLIKLYPEITMIPLIKGVTRNPSPPPVPPCALSLTFNGAMFPGLLPRPTRPQPAATGPRWCHRLSSLNG